ncbi:menaquinone biosynthetic enzyme MqnA/MqnD family protein [Paenibacillus physcomitrellae]|uniref:Chorismate dehydratase n=1 Tax=Paenibacillus physcomitrellae TaxID=1619311 RepID=A0ABQ1FMQ8_9BACL|nr:menaquinone biosynthesis protein [Paenibacillus physcomitrellae]GGA23053.1 chorismate dehydratase [Paenibacillus physcomitrellae]
MSLSANKPTRMGIIDYTNVWPITYYFNEKELSRPIEIITKVPAVLNRAMIAGELDLSPVSSFAYGLGSRKLTLMPGLSVSSEGPVNSILVFSKQPLESVKNGRIALTNTSATSVNLLKIIMDKHYGGEPDYWVSEPDLDAMMETSDAALLIGDNAIKASWHDRGYHVTDLGKVWKEWTGYGMTFAVWAVQQTFAVSQAGWLQEIQEAFHESRKQSEQSLEPLVSKACEQLGGTEAYWNHYFQNLCYDFTEERQRGLQLYFDYCHELGLLEHPVQLSFWNETTRIQVK